MADGLEAPEYLRVGGYDGVILDVMMPKIDGFQVLSTIRQEKNTIPVLMLTAKAEIEDKVAGLDLGANDHLTKPFDLRELADAHYFTVTLDPQTHTARADLAHTDYMQEKPAQNLGRQALEAGSRRVYLQGYRYAVTRGPQGVRVVFLFRKLPLETFLDTRKVLIGICISGLVLSAGLLCLVSGRVVTPIAAAHEQQKAFVTSASHALKTPVAVILGDAQLLQMEYEDNEWLRDIEKQAKRLTEMTQSLVTLARSSPAAPGSWSTSAAAAARAAT